MGMRGKWYTDGHKNKQLDINLEDVIPEGFYEGFTPRKRSKEEIEETKRKREETNIKKYGHAYPLQSGNIKEKQKDTMRKLYGVDNPSKSKECLDRKKETCIERYGTEYSWQSEEVKEKIKETNLQRYGVEHPAQSDMIQEKIKKTNLDRYGCSSPFQSDVVKEKIKKTCMRKYGVYWSCMRPEAQMGYRSNSKTNDEFSEILHNNGLYHDREVGIERFIYDFKVGNTLIELDPTWTHNILYSPFGSHISRVSEDYHQKKSQVGEEAGFRVIHIFDWDDKSKIIDLLKPRERLYARNLTVFGIDNQECREYLNQYHLQGTCNGQSIRLGLRDRFGNLISLMTFGKPRYNKNYQYELLRYCTTANVIGGAEKLFKHFIKEFNPESIISYCDKSKFRGDVYSKLGFRLLSDSRPSKHWYSPNTYERMQHITDNFLRQRGYDQIFDADFGKGTSNEELIIARGYLPIFDCGQSTYIWSSK